ncbi:MAG: DUF362 domain-containing protein [bacterium]|nr:DUF362 domain-containing protein [bacterium]
MTCPTDDRPTNRASSTMNRRGFLHAGSAALAGLAASGTATGQPSPPRVVKVTNAKATDKRGTGDAKIVRDMVDRSIRELTGKDSLRDAWREIVSPDDVVGLKVNLRGGRYLSTQPCVVDAVIAGLKKAGVKDNNILVWDAWTKEFRPAGYTVNMSNKGVRYMATDRGEIEGGGSARKEEVRKALAPFYTDEPLDVGGVPVWFSRILTDEITALINLPLVKDHMIAGVTCSMKNHYGSILNPFDLHKDCCDPWLGALSAAPPIKDKSRLILVDGLRSLYNGGPRDKPQWRWRQNAVIAGIDTVAVDALALRILEAKRKDVGMDSVAGMARHVATAGEMGLGVSDLSQVDVREIDTA